MGFLGDDPESEDEWSTRELDALLLLRALSVVALTASKGEDATCSALARDRVVAVFPELDACDDEGAREKKSVMGFEAVCACFFADFAMKCGGGRKRGEIEREKDHKFGGARDASADIESREMVT